MSDVSDPAIELRGAMSDVLDLAIELRGAP